MKKKIKWNSVGADWKDISGMADGFIEVLEKLGYNVYPNPLDEGSDWYGYIITKSKLNETQLKNLVAQDMEYSSWKSMDDHNNFMEGDMSVLEASTIDYTDAKWWEKNKTKLKKSKT